MIKFSIDQRLLDDCQLLAESDGVSFLLHNNADVAWFIMVPHTSQVEFYQLESEFQGLLCEKINQLSEFIKAHFGSDKINVATIGNVVSQMHIHVIGRRKDDPYWPDVVWGRVFEKDYHAEEVSLIREQFMHNFEID